ncbi:MAG: glycosyltransferase family 4 protein [Flavobacteriaceae bacterium]|nr:glycosyltransferase family 4 protein [Flavobacteriaceae bacterium]
MKKVLIITYYWPPAGGPGVQRWLKFVKYLPEFSVNPIVYIPENPHYPLKDYSLVDEVPENVEFLKLPINEPYRWAGMFSKKGTIQMSKGIISKQKQSWLERMLLWVRGNLFIPDARKAWVKPSVSYLKEYLKNNTIDVIITTGPPHSMHLIGLDLKKQLPVKWIADFRDPWTTIAYHKSLKLSKRSQQKHKDLEKQVLNTADCILVTSPRTKTEFKELTNQPIEVITNGFDIEKMPKQPVDSTFTIAHIGSFLSERNPEILWQVLLELITENQAFKTHFKLNLVGAVSEEVLNSISQYQLENYISIKGYVSHKEALKYQLSAQLLLLVEIDSPHTRAIIPGKLFEYLAAKRPVLAIGPEGSDVAPIIKTTEAGHYFNYSEKDALKKILLNYFNTYLKGESLEVRSKHVEQYSRRALSKTLAKVIEVVS